LAVVVSSPVKPAGLVDTTNVAYPAGTQSLRAGQVLEDSVCNVEITAFDNILALPVSMVLRKGLINVVVL
jgi:hypothetical protein